MNMYSLTFVRHQPQTNEIWSLIVLFLPPEIAFYCISRVIVAFGVVFIVCDDIMNWPWILSLQGDIGKKINNCVFERGSKSQYLNPKTNDGCVTTVSCGRVRRPHPTHTTHVFWPTLFLMTASANRRISWPRRNRLWSDVVSDGLRTLWGTLCHWRWNRHSITPTGSLFKIC